MCVCVSIIIIIIIIIILIIIMIYIMMMMMTIINQFRFEQTDRLILTLVNICNAFITCSVTAFGH